MSRRERPSRGLWFWFLYGATSSVLVSGTAAASVGWAHDRAVTPQDRALVEYDDLDDRISELDEDESGWVGCTAKVVLATTTAGAVGGAVGAGAASGGTGTLIGGGLGGIGGMFYGFGVGLANC